MKNLHTFGMLVFHRACSSTSSYYRPCSLDMSTKSTTFLALSTLEVEKRHGSKCNHIHHCFLKFLFKFILHFCWVCVEGC